MKLLFVQGGSRVKKDTKGQLYVDGNFNNSVFEDYYKLADSVTFLLREDSKNYSDSILENKFNKLDPKFSISLLKDVYRGIISRFNFASNIKIKRIIKNEVSKSDKVIIRSIGNFYTNYVYKCCVKQKKQFLVEVTGFAFDGLWHHSWKGKLVAVYREWFLKKAIKKAPYVVYVTEGALQKRYPTSGKSLGCSDVRISKDILEKNKYNLHDNHENYNKLVTVAFLDVKWKGHKDVLKAIYELKKSDIIYDYFLIGSGHGLYLKKIAKKLNIENQIHFIGPLEHAKVFEVLPTMDIYIQPSYQEGLCRAIVEAMSCGLPVICSNAGGNHELIEQKYIFKKGNVKEIIELLKKINYARSDIPKMSNNNFLRAQKYEETSLKNKRDRFYKEFISN